MPQTFLRKFDLHTRCRLVIRSADFTFNRESLFRIFLGTKASTPTTGNNPRKRYRVTPSAIPRTFRYLFSPRRLSIRKFKYVSSVYISKGTKRRLNSTRGFDSETRGFQGKRISLVQRNLKTRRDTRLPRTTAILAFAKVPLQQRVTRNLGNLRNYT